MKLLLDQNLSHRLVRSLADAFPNSTHVRDIGLGSADDDAVWGYAAARSFIIISKDSDLHQLSFLRGHPPKEVDTSGDGFFGRTRCSHSASLLAEDP